MVWNFTKPINNPEEDWDYELIEDFVLPFQWFAKKGTRFKIIENFFAVIALQAASGEFNLYKTIYDKFGTATTSSKEDLIIGVSYLIEKLRKKS